MKLTNEMNFPHPVLAGWRDDFTLGLFEVDITARESKKNNQVTLHCTTRLESHDIDKLLDDGSFQLGCFITCRSTGYRNLIEIRRPEDKHQFKEGALLDKVSIRPIIWATKSITNWMPGLMHREFSGSHNIQSGAIVGMAEEVEINVAKADLPSLETIFQLNVDDELVEGEFSVDMYTDKITILAARETYNLIETLRATSSTASVVWNALYVPVFMTVLSQIKTDEGFPDYSQFESYRWVDPFRRRCEKLEIAHQEGETLMDAQKLLEHPFNALENLTGAE